MRFLWHSDAHNYQVIICICCCCYTSYIWMPEFEVKKDLPEKMKHWEHLRIPRHVIKDCTQDFSEANFIGKGGYGRVYKGILSWENHRDQPVAVKRLDVSGLQGNKEFLNEVAMLSQYRHENIITLIGFCDDSEEMRIVYEYASRGSLDTYLHDSTGSGVLSWPQRIKICVGAASALAYLHNGVAEKHRIIHRDIKSANVLLDENWNAKLSDFGLSKIGLANQQNTFVITNLAGTHGYCDPQYERTGILTKESDVFSFGVVLFEVLCGRLGCVFHYHDERRFLHHLARTYYKKRDLHKIIDHRIRKDINPKMLSKFSVIAYRCLQESREKRPTSAEVAFQLKEVWKLQATTHSSTRHTLAPSPCNNLAANKHLRPPGPCLRSLPEPLLLSQVRKEKLGDRITALQQLVSPFGKADTGSVLLEAVNYIIFLQEQVKALSTPYLHRNSTAKSQEIEPYNLRNKGLCLVPISYTVGISSSNGADIWAPIKTNSPDN